MNKHIKNPLGAPTPDPQGSDPRRGKRRFNPMWIYLSAVLILLMLFFLPSEQPTNSKEVGWTEFQQLLRKEVATKVEAVSYTHLDVYKRQVRTRRGGPA